MIGNKGSKLCQICVLLFLLCAPGAYGGSWRGALRSKRIGAWVSRRIFKASQQPRTGRSSVGASRRAATRSVASASSLPRLPSARSPLVLEPVSSLPINSLSRPMQQRVAREARAYLDELDWVKTPRQPSTYNDINNGIFTLGNLTRMSEEQYAHAKQVYEQAVEYMKEVSKSLNAEIYYMGTSEMETLSPEQIRQRLSEILQGKNLVADARAIWGDNYTLVRIAIYWQNMQDVYNVLGTGILSMKGTGKLEAVKRLDGHVYVAEEFGLVSGGVDVELPKPDWRNPSSWLSLNSQGFLPKRLQVAVLQDDEQVIGSLKKMKKRAGLRNWKMDFYDDPEAFLNQVTYEQYDMILTDVLMKNGGGRYLARQLRNRGYQGTILTLSGFESIHGGEEFFYDGIDGMIGLGWTPDLPERIWARLNNYFILKKKYGWTH